MNVISSGKRFDTRIRMKASRASATRILGSISLFVQRAFSEQTAEPIILLTLLTFVLFVGRYQEIADGGRSENIPQVVIQLVPAEILATDRKDASGITDASTTTAQTLASKDASRRHTGDEDKSSISAFASSDCRGRVPKGYARIFIADRADGKSGSGVASDPFDGSTAQKLDTLLRTRSEAGVTNLVVCIGPGTFQTEGTYDYVVGVGHLNKTQSSGFTVNRGWKVHGERMDRTILKLRDLYLDPSTGRYAVGHIISTYDPDAYGVELSDLTLDDNYPALKPIYSTDLQLEAVSLRSNLGHNWIHNIHVMNTAGEWTEAFPVEISSPDESPTASSGNVVEYVVMDHWASGKCTAIAIANAVAEVRHNTVVGHHIAYGGWQMSDVYFHDNSAIGGVYGFNIDSLRNVGVVISHNQIVHPLSYGLVIGGVGQFMNFSISDNVVTLASKTPWNTLYGLIFQGNVTGARVIGNRIFGEQTPLSARIFGLYEKGPQNAGNVFEGNRISRSFNHLLQGADCVHGSVDQNGAALGKLGNTQSAVCLPGK